MSIEPLTLSTLDSTLVMTQINPIVINLLVGLFLLISIVMILIVLIQRPQGGGLGGAFGAGGGGGAGGAGQTAFGTKTGDVLTGGTIAIFVLFLTFAIILNFVTRPPEADAAQPTIASPTTTEPIPVDENAVDDAVEEGTDAVNDAVDDTIDAAEDAAEDIIDDASEQIEPVADPASDPASDDEN